MLKNLLRLLVSSATFVALMLVANIAIANPAKSITTLQVDHQQPSLSVNLNVVSPSLEFIAQSHNSLSDHLGCSCGVCTQTI